MGEEFKIGDVVRLKGESWYMVVYDPPRQMVRMLDPGEGRWVVPCTWIDRNGHVQNHDFFTETIEHRAQR